MKGATPGNIRSVYLPYMAFDGRAAVRLDGFGEILRHSPTEADPAYRGERYTVTRTLDLEVDDLIVEARADKAVREHFPGPENVINAVLPYDVKNIVRFDAAYLAGEHTAERRDMDIEAAEPIAVGHLLTIAREEVRPSIAQYDHGVQWESEQIRLDGARWTAVLLPVWLYSYMHTSFGRTVTYHVAVNGRTGATVPSIPVTWSKVIGAGAAAAALGAMLLLPFFTSLTITVQ